MDFKQVFHHILNFFLTIVHVFMDYLKKRKQCEDSSNERKEKSHEN